MKLITPITSKTDILEFKELHTHAKVLNTIQGMLPFVSRRQEQPGDVKSIQKYLGKCTFDPVQIDFEVNTNPNTLLGTKLDAIIIGDKTLLGVIPVEHIKDNIYECVIDMVQ